MRRLRQRVSTYMNVLLDMTTCVNAFLSLTGIVGGVLGGAHEQLRHTGGDPQPRKNRRTNDEEGSF